MKQNKLFVMLVAFLLVFSIGVPSFAAANQEAVQVPVFLNGEPEFTTTGPTNLTNLITDAMRTRTGADIALMDAQTVKASVEEGDLTREKILKTVSLDETIVTVKLNGEELHDLLQRHMQFASPGFPHFSGMEIVAEKYLESDGVFAAHINSAKVGGNDINRTKVYTVAIPEKLLLGRNGWRFSEQMEERFGRLVNVLLRYMQDEVVPKSDGRLTILEQRVSTSELVAKLSANVPDDVVVYLVEPDVVPDAVFYALSGKDRKLIFHIGKTNPYTIIFEGKRSFPAAAVDLKGKISNQITRDERTASSADEKAMYIDFKDNATLPEGVLLQLNVGKSFEPGTVLYLYEYKSGDLLLKSNYGLVVDYSNTVSFEIEKGKLYLLNPGQLNATAIFTLPTSDNPFNIGIAVILALFAIFVISYLLYQYKKHKKRPA